MAVFTSSVFAMRKKMITDALKAAGACTPETARTMAEAGLEHPELFTEYTRQLTDLGVIRRTENGRYYLAE
jgi:predicted transcriptional regulator